MNAPLQAPPHDLLAERAVLGGILLENAGLRACQALALRPEHFFRDSHAIIFDAMLGLFGAEQPIDSITLRSWLKDAGKLERVGDNSARGDEYLLGLTDAIPTVTNVVAHAQIILEKHTRRRIKAALLEGAAKAQAGEIEDALEFARQALDQRADKRVPTYTLRQLIDYAEDAGRVHSGTYGGLRTGFELVDRYLSEPLAPGEVVTIAGQSGSGKSHLMLTCAVRAAKAGHPVGVVSLEDPKKRWGRRAAAMLNGELNPQLLGQPQLNFEQRERIEKAKKAGDALRFTFVEQPNGTVAEAIAAIETLAESGAKMIVLDHLHALTLRASKSETNADALKNATIEIVRAARRAGAVLVLGAQLGQPEKANRFAEPTVFDLRDTSQIRISSDVILLTWKPNDLSGAPILGKVGKLKDETARPRFKLEWYSNGALFDISEHAPLADEEGGSKHRGFGRKAGA